MAKEDKITLDAEVVEALPDAMYRVTIELSPYDMTKGRIVYRF
jgi:translation initiation factor IF-1